MKKRYIRGMVKAINVNRAVKYVKSNSLEKFKIRMFKVWQSRVNRVHINRAKFKGKMTKKFKQNFYNHLRTYTLTKIRFRAGMKNLLKTRALNLLKIALNRGLKRVWREKLIAVNLWKAAII
jgi:hypothetical protein